MYFGIGLVCFIIGFITVRYFGASSLAIRLGQLKISDYVGVLLMALGVVLLIGSIVVKLWHVMP